MVWTASTLLTMPSSRIDSDYYLYTLSICIMLPLFSDKHFSKLINYNWDTWEILNVSQIQSMVGQRAWLEIRKADYIVLPLTSDLKQFKRSKSLILKKKINKKPPQNYKVIKDSSILKRKWFYQKYLLALVTWHKQKETEKL